MDGMRQRHWTRKKRKPEASSPLVGGVEQKRRTPLFHGSPGSSIKVDGRPGAIVRRSTHQISIYNDVKDRRSGAFVIQREARDPVEGGPKAQFIYCVPETWPINPAGVAGPPKCG